MYHFLHVLLMKAIVGLLGLRPTVGFTSFSLMPRRRGAVLYKRSSRPRDSITRLKQTHKVGRGEGDGLHHRRRPSLGLHRDLGTGIGDSDLRKVLQEENHGGYDQEGKNSLSNEK